MCYIENTWGLRLPVAKHVDRELHCSNSKYKFPNSKCKFPSALPYGQVLWTLRDPRHPRILGCGRLQRFAESPKLLSNFSFSGNFVPVGQFFFANPQIRLVSFLDLGIARTATRMDIYHPQTFLDFFSTKKFKKILSTEFFDFLEFLFLPGCWGTCRLLAPSSAHNLRISKKHLSVQ